MEKKFVFAALVILVLIVASLVLYKSQDLRRSYKSQIQKELARVGS